MEKVQSRKRMSAIIAAVVIVVALIGGTFMWWSANDSVKNEMALDRFDVKITEKFDPDTPIFPGANVTKEVGVTNNSNIPAVVRVKLVETVELADGYLTGDIVKWSTDKELATGQIIVTVSQGQLDTLTSASGWTGITSPDPDVTVLSRQIPAANGTGTTTEYFAYVTASKRLAKYDPAGTGTLTYAYYSRTQVAAGVHQMTTGELGSLPLPSGTINIHDVITVGMGTINPNPGVTTAGWVLDPATGWYYYNQALYGNATTENLVESVAFSSNLPDEFQGAKYTLTPTMEAAQYDLAAIPATWTDVLHGMIFRDGSAFITIP